MLYAIVALLLLLADQSVKYWTTTHIVLDTGKQTLLPGLIDMRNIHNTGSAFSFLGNWAGARWLFLAVTVLFTVLVILALCKKVIRGGFGRWMALIVLAGALGNAIDRSLYGYVIDMFEFSFFPRFPVFNAADIYITVCGILFCVYILLSKEPLGAPAEAEMRPGPGGSMTRPAPKKPVEKAPKEPKERRSLFPAKAGSSAEVGAEPAAVPENKAGSFVRRRRSAPEKTERDLRFEQLKRPVVTHESFLDMTRRMPGDDPFAEWEAKAAEQSPVRIVEPEEPTVVLPKTDPSVPTKNIPSEEEPTRVLPRVEMPEPVFEAKPAEIPETPAEPEAAKPAEPVPEEPAEPETAVPAAAAADVEEDPVFDLEDILNEFRDL